ncbi:hypothetical protein GH714_040646 [Hevea brasiliensis]|uniref:Uncharacterized protein n=1 Tax=Hevea brasiliensis TaxID=3981 RepID=A0A6A6MS84_HEVBR|nr:hypothetical protein GH714_040646 [Hevea brasiliensis]
MLNIGENRNQVPILTSGANLGGAKLDPVRFNPRRREMMEDDTSDDEEINFEYVAHQGQERGCQNFHQHHRRDDEFELKMDIPTLSRDLDIKGEPEHAKEDAKLLKLILFKPILLIPFKKLWCDLPIDKLIHQLFKIQD